MKHIFFDGSRGYLHVVSGPQTAGQHLGLLITHGLGEHAGSYYHLQQSLTAAGIRWWAYDQRGHGRSAGTPVLIESVDDLVADCISVYAHTVGASGLPGAMFGHSLGQRSRSRPRSVLVRRPWFCLPWAFLLGQAWRTSRKWWQRGSTR
ncbi:alpha/beta fold hydrolase [Nakamurella antarctica]|uniref:Alpha/beta fold hydrolase n=1 Tax=Nakamurella antarctica TaxID=1902245 RepID=A0A3G8ZPB8_9ACTN|nr:alpha/beta fold hydrolase [Nakamurella antarctica]